jgi:hypothetical protein
VEEQGDHQPARLVTIQGGAEGQVGDTIHGAGDSALHGCLQQGCVLVLDA